MQLNPIYYINKYIDKRISKYKEGGTLMQYNPLLVEMDDTYNERHLTRRILENSVWYSGIEQDIEYFYQHEAPKFFRNGKQSESLNYFWNKSTENSSFRKIHLGPPQLIARTMVTLLIGNGYDIKVESEANEEELNETLDNILNDNSFNTLLQRAIETDTWAGGSPWKLSYKRSISEWPLLEVWQPENYSHKVVSGRIVEDYFYSYYSKGNVKYRLTETYGVDDDGAFIDFKLHQLIYDDTSHSQATNKEKIQRWIEVPLTECEETENLKKIVFKGYYEKLSLYKPNKVPNSEFRNSMLGESDYSGSYGAFDALDEIGSTWIQEFRDAKLYRYFPKEYVLKTPKGSEQLPSDFNQNHVLYEETPGQDSEQKIQYDQGDLRTDKHTESFKTWITTICNNAGLNPLTLGLTGMESIDASAESQQEREKTSIRTRNNKIGLWTEFLKKYMKIVIEFNEIIQTQPTISKDQITYNVNVQSDFEILPTFEDYIIKSSADRTKEVNEDQGKAWDIASSVEYVHEDKTDTEKALIIRNIKIENGIPLTEVDIIAGAEAEETETGQEAEVVLEEEIEEELE